MKDLVFFGTEGNSLNFYYNEQSRRYEGKIIFDHNSSDTFKTYGLYTFERIRAFEYQDTPNLWLDKFQLFNEYGIYFYGNSNEFKQVNLIETVNNDNTFFSKWIHGDNFDALFPKGSMIRFDVSIAEFSNYNQFYQVVNVKKNAILIISNIDNNTFNTLYSAFLSNPSNYTNITISGGNLFSINNYVNTLLEPNIAEWSEPYFYQKLFSGQKLTFVNSLNNSGVYTLLEKNIIDTISNKYKINYNSYSGGTLTIELTLKTDLPLLYNDGLNFNGNRIDFLNTIPTYLKPGIQFQVLNSVSNSNILTVANISAFNALTQYTIGSQVLYDNTIYQCVSNYSSSDVNSVLPTDTSFWSEPNYLNVEESLVLEYLVGGQLYLTTNVFVFTQDFLQSKDITYTTIVEKYKDVFKIFDVTLVYEKGDKIVAYLDYTGSYVDIKFYDDINGNITTLESTNIRNLEISEVLTNELNEDISERLENIIQFTDIDDYGIRVIINGEVYYEDVQFVYNGLDIDLNKTIDQTLKNFHQNNFLKLLTLGIVCELIYFGPGSNPLFNSIKLKTVYPNVPLVFSVEVGTTANYNIPHSALSIVDMGGVFILRLNGRSYLERFDTSINETLNNWYDRYRDNILYYGIEMSIQGNTIIFYIKEQSTKVDYTVSVGKTSNPGDDLYIIRMYKRGNLGMIVTANQITTTSATASFEEIGFATGMITSLMNSDYPLNNQDYNILYLDPDKMTLSYQGPFWGNTGSSVYGAYLAWSFDENAFGYDPSATYSLVSAVVPTYSVNNIQNISNSYDLLYNSQNESMIVSSLGFEWSEIDINNIGTNYGFTTSSTYSSIIKTNVFNGLQYILYNSGSSDQIWTIDTLSNAMNLVASYSSINDFVINNNNGDCYIAQGTQIDIFDTSGTQITPSILQTAIYLVYSESENVIYSSDGLSINEIDGVTRLVDSNILQSVSSYFYYSYISNKVYFGDSNLYSLQFGVVTSIPSVSGNPDDYDVDIYNNKMFISSNGIIYTLDINDNLINSYNILVSDGELVFSPYDRNVYYFTNPYLYVIDDSISSISATVSMSATVSNSAFNYYRNSIYGIYDNGLVFEVTTNNPYIAYSSSVATYSVISDTYYGTLSSEYVGFDDLLLKTREFIRKPRFGFETDNDNKISYKWSWESDNVPELMLIDFSGNQLSTTGSYAYTGPKPLDQIRVNRLPNKDITKVSEAIYQQTVFNSIKEEMVYIDSSEDISFEPEAFSIFLGFNSPEEGVVSSNLILTEVEDVEFYIQGSPINNDIITIEHISNNTDIYAKVTLDINSTSFFLDRNLKVEQILKLNIKDITNTSKEYLSSNNGLIFRIRSIGARELILDYLDEKYVTNEILEVIDYPSEGITTYPKITFTIQEKQVAYLSIYGQTEIEDYRYKIELNNIGHNLYPEDAFIFKNYDLDEGGVDWHFLNKKRKEMLLVKGDIFNYLGSYKSIVNAINLFGYNDLELYEYYRNINTTSKQYSKLFKVEIPDIFDNSVPGWTENDYFKNTFNNSNYEVTNLFNLTYRITDKEGNFLLTYSTNEIITKLTGLKKWLAKNVVPITHKILDITGRADFVSNTYITHDVYDVTILNQRSSMTPVVGNINEVYVLPVNSGSTVYNVVLESSYQENDKNVLPDYYNILIKTYQVYSDWKPFTSYEFGEYVKYLDDLYVSVLSLNRLNKPNKYIDSPLWDEDNSYVYGQVVLYLDRYYRYLVLNPEPKFVQDVLTIGIDPNDLVISNEKTYVTIQGEDKVIIVDNAEYEILPTEFSVGNSPTKILSNGLNGYLYVMTTAGVDVIDPTTDTIVTNISTGIDIPIDIIINNVSGKLYISTSNSDIRIYDSSNLFLSTLLTSNIVISLEWAKSLDRIYCLDSIGNQILVINSNTDLFLLPIPTTIGNKQLFNNSDSFLYFLDSSNYLYKTNTPTVTLVYNTYTIVDFLISDSGNLYISNSNNEIVVIDINGTILNTYSVGVSGTMVIDSYNNDIYISDISSNLLIVYNITNSIEKTRITLTDTSPKMVFDLSRNSVYGIIDTSGDFFRIALKNNSDIPYQNSDWSDVTEWQLVPYKPVQTIKEFRNISDLTTFNFTVDSNIDPYIVTEITSDNGYGQIYTDRKNYVLYQSEDGRTRVISTDYVESSNP